MAIFSLEEVEEAVIGRRSRRRGGRRPLTTTSDMREEAIRVGDKFQWNPSASVDLDPAYRQKDQIREKMPRVSKVDWTGAAVCFLVFVMFAGFLAVFIWGLHTQPDMQPHTTRPLLQPTSSWSHEPPTEADIAAFDETSSLTPDFEYTLGNKHHGDEHLPTASTMTAGTTANDPYIHKTVESKRQTNFVSGIVGGHEANPRGSVGTSMNLQRGLLRRLLVSHAHNAPYTTDRVLVRRQET
ncbi:uncharacterized protein LOC135387594 isoform X2 [Ornithodoros turicata]|uniref:uncharacterized protein LOC135387594 isoform X2 n=1 Tax=Ornithodoros turicata TaxID=34597 RepID=UPI00313A40A5